MRSRPIHPDRIRRILIRGTNWVGDAVMSIPAMREVRRIFPDARISLVVRPWVKDVYSTADFVDEIIEFDRQSAYRGWNGLRRFSSELKCRQFDMAILMQNAFEAALLAWRARIPIRLGYGTDGRRMLLTHPCKIDPSVKKLHQAYYYLGILAGAGLLEKLPWDLPGYALDIKLGVRDTDRDGARQLLHSHGVEPGQLLIGINPGAYYGSAKRWLSERYADVADSLAQKYGARILIFGAPGEANIAAEIASRMAVPPAILAGSTTLGQLMALLKECRLLLTNDSGPMHLAAALDVPLLALFGSTSEIATGPLSRQAEVIRHPVSCSPCFLRDCPIDFRCMKSITSAEVIRSAERKLSESAALQG